MQLPSCQNHHNHWVPSSAGVLIILLLTTAGLSELDFWQLLNSAPVQKLTEEEEERAKCAEEMNNTGGNICPRCFQMFSLPLRGPSYALLYIYTSAHRLTIYTIAVWRQQNNPFVLDITYLFHQFVWQCINRLSCSRACRIQVIHLAEAHTCILCWPVSGTTGIF